MAHYQEARSTFVMGSAILLAMVIVLAKFGHLPWWEWAIITAMFIAIAFSLVRYRR